MLAAIRPEDATAHQDLLRAVFRAEMDHRRQPGAHEHFENLYQCAFLLNRIGDPSDAPMMWEAKHIDMDTGAGFDVEFMAGAGIQPTLRYLRRHGHRKLARELRRSLNHADPDLAEWVAYRRRYFYGD